MRRTILILLFGDIGDTLLTVPAIRAVRRRYPAARLLLLAKEIPADVVARLDLVDDIILFDKHLFDQPLSLLKPRNVLRVISLYRRLRRERITTVVIFHHLVTWWGALKFALLAFGTGARERAGLDNGKGWFLTLRARDRGFGAKHESEYWLDVAGLIDATGPLTLEAPVTNADRSSVAALLERHGLSNRALLAIHPGTGWYGPGRRWEAGRFAEAGRLVADRQDMMCVIVGSSAEREIAGQVARLLGPRGVNFAGETSIGELGALLERCRLLLANDGGVGHMAAAVGTRVVSVFGPSNDRAWRPLGGVVVAADIPCRPCFYRDFSRGRSAGFPPRECLQMVTPEMVARTAFRLLREQSVEV